MTVGVNAASICVKVIVRYMYAAFVLANVRPCAAPIGIILRSQKLSEMPPPLPTPMPPPGGSAGVRGEGIP